MRKQPFLFQGLSCSDKKRSEELELLRAYGMSENEIFVLLRDKLTVLNSKATTLLTFNAVALASLSVWASNTNFTISSEIAVFHLLLDSIYVGFLVSCLLCLCNTSVYWPVGNPLSEKNLIAYLKVRDLRTIQHRTSQIITILGVVILLFASLHHMSNVYSFVNGNCMKNSKDPECSLSTIDTGH